MHLDSCHTAEQKVLQLEETLRDRSTASEADDRDNQLLLAREELTTLRVEIEEIKKDAIEAEEDHRKAVSELRAVGQEKDRQAAARHEKVAEELEKKELELLTVTSALQTKETEIATLVEAARTANDAAAEAAAAAGAAESGRSTPAPAAAMSSFSPTQLELEGIQRLQDAVGRLRGERDGLMSELDEMRLALSFSVRRIITLTHRVSLKDVKH